MSKQRRGRPTSKSSKQLKDAVADLFMQGFNAAQIGKLKGFSTSYIARLLRQLKDECPELINNHLVPKEDESSGWKKNVHAQKIRAFVHWSSDKYAKSPNVSFKNFVDGVDVHCQGKYIFLQSNKKKFYAESEQKALWKSLHFWQGVLAKIEDRLNVVIFKRGAQAFEFLYQEFETSDSAVAVDAERKGHVWRVFHSEDGKLRLSVDWSDGTPNHETHHRRDAHLDSVVFEKHVNSILDNPQAPTFAELANLVHAIGQQNKETAQGLKVVVDVLQQTVLGAHSSHNKPSPNPDSSSESPSIIDGGVPDYFG